MALLSFVFAALFRPARAAFYYPTPQVHLLEHILVDNWGAHASNFSSAITPCTRYVTQTGDAAVNSGRTTAAQWMRVLFHDFITADVGARTGGVDASIGFETARVENKGSAFNDSFTFWGGFVNEYVSMADLVALGTVMSNNLCGGKLMPYQPGRVDATGADSTTGVPAPETSLTETLGFFQRAGFDEVDSIGLTACGHTLGSVHAGGFPEVVENSTISPTNTNGGANFDSTRGLFDPLVLHEYLSWTGRKGGPLVTSFNESSRSDLRLYESDGNATMEALRKQGEGFLSTCVKLLGRAMNTVPSHVSLKDPIQPIGVKPVNVTYGFSSDGDLTLTGSFRVLSDAGTPDPTSIEMSIGGQNFELLALPEKGVSVFGRAGNSYGSTAYYPFAVSGDIARSTSFSVQGKHFTTRNDAFILANVTTLEGVKLNVSVAVSPAFTCADLDVTVAVPVTQPGTVAPKLVRESLLLVQSGSRIDNYSMCLTSSEFKQTPRGLVAVSISWNLDIIDTLLVSSEAAGW